MNTHPFERPAEQTEPEQTEPEQPRPVTPLADGVALEPMLPADIDAVYALEQDLFPLDAWPRAAFEAELASTDTRTYVAARRGGTIVGYAGLMYVAPLADIQTIAVVPEREGQGIGTAMLTYLLERASGFGAEAAMLEVREDNARARRLYERFGFEQIHVRRHYYRDGVNALIMRKSLERA